VGVPGTTFKVDYIFADQTDLVPAAGWTETFYIAGTSLGNVLTTVKAVPDTNARLALLANTYALAEIRVSDVFALRDSQVYIVPNGMGVGQYPSPGHPTPGEDVSEQPWDGLLVQMQDVAFKSRRSFPLRGLPVGVITQNFQYQANNAVWNPAFQAWVARHTASPGGPAPLTPYLLQQRNFTPVASPTTIAVGPDGRSLIITWSGGVPAAIIAALNPTPPTAVNPFISIRNCFGADHVNTIWKIASLTLPNTLTTYPHRRQLFGNPGGTPLIAIVNYNYPGIAYMTPLRGMKRSTGGPFARLHGRARTR